MVTDSGRGGREVRITADDAAILLGLLDILRSTPAVDQRIDELAERAVDRLRRDMRSALDDPPSSTG